MALRPIKMPPVPAHLRSDPSLYRWLQDLVALFGAEGGIDATQISLAGKSLTDLGTRNHSDLQNILQADAALTDTAGGKHVTNALMNDLTTRITALEASIVTANGDLAALEARVVAVEADIVTLFASQATQNATLTDHENRLIAGGL